MSKTSGSLFATGIVAALAIGALTKAILFLMIAAGILLLFCLITRPGPTLSFLVLGLIGSVLNRIPDPFLITCFGILCLVWAISILRKSPPPRTDSPEHLSLPNADSEKRS